MKSLIKKLDKKRWFVPLLLLIIVVISYGQTLSMYFLIDDNALIYKLQHVNEPLGFWGAGAAGSGPYRHIVDQFVPFYPLFGVDPFPYFAVGLLLYFVTSLVVYYFTKVLSGKKSIALLGAIVYSSGYIGAETLFGIVNSWQTSRGIIMAIVTFLLYWKFIKTKNFFYFIASVIFFYLSLDTVYIRAHGLIFALVLFDLIYWPFKFRIKAILSSIARLTPFFFIHYKIYLGSIAYAREFGIFSIISQILNEGKHYLATIPIQDIGNVFIPNSITNFIGNYFEKYLKLHMSIELGPLVAGVFVLIFFLLIILRYFKKEPNLIKLLVFSFGWVGANFVMFYAREPLHTLWSTHRYLSYSFVGVAMFWSVAIYLINKHTKRKKIKFSFSILFVFLLLSLIISSSKYQFEFNQRRSLPAKDFFNKFTQSVPKLNKGDVLYFDIANDSQVSARFGSFFGGMFSEASNFAIYTPGIDYMNDFLFTYNFDEVLSMLSGGSLELNNLYTFYYGKDGLVDTTVQTRALLAIGDQKKLENIKVSNERIEIIADKEVSSLTPAKLEFVLKAALKKPSIPYVRDVKFDVAYDEKKLIFSYLTSRARYYSLVSAKAASYWKEQIPQFLVDERLDTAWRGHRGYWDEYFHGREKNEYLILDTAWPMNIGGIRWFTAQKPLIASEYTISVSDDAKNWTQVRSVVRNTELVEGSEVVDIFEPVLTRFVRIDIIKTIGNDGPEIKEMELIGSSFTKLDKVKVDKVRAEPFAKINTQEEYNMAANFVRENSKLKLFWKSDADPNWLPTNYLDSKLTVDNNYYRYEFDLPAAGINWQAFRLEGFNFPADIDINSVQLIYKPYEKK